MPARYDVVPRLCPYLAAQVAGDAGPGAAGWLIRAVPSANTTTTAMTTPTAHRLPSLPRTSAAHPAIPKSTSGRANRVSGAEVTIVAIPATPPTRPKRRPVPTGNTGYMATAPPRTEIPSARCPASSRAVVCVLVTGQRQSARRVRGTGRSRGCSHRRRTHVRRTPARRRRASSCTGCPTSLEACADPRLGGRDGTPDA